MKLTIGDTGITLGGGPNYFLNSEWPGMDPSLNNITTIIPRTDFSKNIDDFIEPKIRTFSGKLIGDDPKDFRTRKRELASLIRTPQTFTLVDDFDDGAGFTTFETYTFTGKIIAVETNNDLRSTLSNYVISIFCEDPTLFLTPGIDVNLGLAVAGFTFPLIFPFIFAGGDNSVTVTNTGLVTVFPTITVTGGAADLTIVVGTATTTNQTFTYSQSIPSGEDIVITPIPNDPVKIRDQNGASAIAFTNNNFEALAINPGDNTFSFFSTSGIDSNSNVNIKFNSGFVGI